MTAEDQRELVEMMYDRIIHSANKFLTHAKTFSISVLQGQNPSYAEMALHLRELAGIIDILAEQIDDALTGIKANEYVSYMERMAAAVDKGCAETLEAVVNELDQRSFL